METTNKPTISVTIAQELLTKVDREADKLYISRSAWIVTAIAQKIQSEELIRALPEFTETIRVAIREGKSKNEYEYPYMDATREGREKLDFLQGLDFDIANAKK